MGIHGIFKQIGPGTRISLAKVSAEHFAATGRAFRLAIDISIWLFQIQAGKGGSNPALRTFYYRLLRLLSLNIHPLFVFDGPNKPLFKRNKKVGGPGVRVASVPEFLAKQLLKEFGFPWHVAAGEAEAECALLQVKGIVDAVLSEDVDTLMFGSEVTLRNWSAEGSQKSPTHVNIYRAAETKALSGMDREGMILVALMSGGDYLPEGIPGCGPKLACDAARAGYGKDLCALNRKDEAGIQAWKDRLEDEIVNNRSKVFTRKLSKFKMPEDFPNMEVLGYYTHPCVSSEEKLVRLRSGLKWDQDIDYAALRIFAADAFDWRCLGGAQKFVRNLAPAMLVRKLRTCSSADSILSEEAQEEFEKNMVSAIHGKRNHKSTDGILEFRVSFTAANHVPIDLDAEEKDDDFRTAGGEFSDDEAGLEIADGSDSDTSAVPQKKRRVPKPYDPTIPEKIWIPKDFLQAGCPLMIEIYESGSRNAKKLAEERKKANEAKMGAKPKAVRKKAAEKVLAQANKITAAFNATKGTVTKGSQGVRDIEQEAISTIDNNKSMEPVPLRTNFQLPSTQPVESATNVPAGSRKNTITASRLDPTTTSSRDREQERPFAKFSRTKPVAAETRNVAKNIRSRTAQVQKTPGKKRKSSELSSTPGTQRTLDSWITPSPARSKQDETVVVNLITSPVRPSTPSPSSSKENERPVEGGGFLISDDDDTPKPLQNWHDSSCLTKRQKRSPFRRSKTAPIRGVDAMDESTDGELPDVTLTTKPDTIESLDLTMSSPPQLPLAHHAMPIRLSPQRPISAGIGDLMPKSKPSWISSQSVISNLEDSPGITLVLHENPVVKSTTAKRAKPSVPASTDTLAPRRSPRVIQKKALLARKSMAGAFQVIDLEEEHNGTPERNGYRDVEELWLMEDDD